METKLRLEILAQWLQKVTKDDFYYDSSRDGQLEYTIAQSQVEVCNKIGSYLEEILETNELDTPDIPGFEGTLDDLNNLKIR